MPTISKLSGSNRNQAPSGTIAGKSQPVSTGRAPPKKKKQPESHRSLFGSITHAVQHPGLSDVLAAISPPMTAAWLAEHSHVPGLTQAGRASQALFESPFYLAAHPKAGAKNLGTIARGITESPYALYKASGIDPLITSATHPFAPKRTRTGLYGISTPAGMGGRTVGQSSLNALEALWHSTKADYSARYGKDWKAQAKKQPLFNVADLLMVAGPVGEVGAGAKALRTLSKLGVETEDILAARRMILEHSGDTSWEKLNPLDKLRAVKAEVRQPGLLTTGKAKTRSVSVRSGAGEPITVEQPLASTPLRRGFQNAADNIAQTFPHLPVAGARSRALRGLARQVNRATDRVLASIPGAESLKKLSAAGRERAYWQSQIVKHATDESGNIIHDHAAVTARLGQLHEALTHEYGHPGWEAKFKADFPELADVVNMGKQRAFGQETLKGIEAAMKYTPGHHYENVITALKHATVVGENAIKDTEGFSNLQNVRTKLLHRLKVLPEGSDEIAKVHAQLTHVDDLINTKQSFIKEMLDSSRRKVTDYIDTAPVDAPERHAWEKFMVDELKMTPEQAQQQLTFSDVLARKFGGSDPKGWYASNVGKPTGQSAQQVVDRLGQGGAFWQDFPEHGMTHLIEGDVAHPAPNTAYYSKAQKEIAKGWGKKGTRQAGQVEKALRTNISKKEWENTGLDNFFKQYGKDEPITQALLHEFLANRLNQYNIRETHLVNTEYAKDLGFGTRWGGGAFTHEYGYWEDQLLSRTPGEGEYHEIFFDLPQGTIHPTDYMSKGKDHWDRPNVTGHIRFQVFREDGKLKLLIEEVQSDWARQYTSQTKAGKEYEALPADWTETYLRLRQERMDTRREYERTGLHLRAIREERDQMRWRIEQGLPEDPQDLEKLVEAAKDAEIKDDQAWTAFNHVDQEMANHMEKKKGQIPPPPMRAQEAQRLAVHRVLRHAADNGIDEVIVSDPAVQNARNLAVSHALKESDPENLWNDILTKQGDVPLEGEPYRHPRDIEDALGRADDWVGETHFHRTYGKEIPDAVESHIGVKGVVVDDAYQGFLGTQNGARTKVGAMRGTVYKMDDAARAKAVEADYLYQRQPEWGKLPRGANEVLANGKRQIHMFQKADVSTWIHELGHSAVYDLDAADQATLVNHYGEGAKDFSSMKAAGHENFARDWERFVRTGDLSFLPRAVADVFEKIQAWMTDTYRALKNANPDAEIPAEVEDVFRRMLTPEGDTPDIFMPHRSRGTNLRGARMQSGAPRATRTIGTEVQDREPTFRRNKLALLRSGMVDRDPGHLFEHVNRLVSLQKANQIREYLLLHSEPLTRNWDVNFHDQYVIKAPGTNPNKVLYDALEAADNPEDIRQTISKFVDDNIIDSQDKLDEAWKGDQQLYKIDKKLVDGLFLNVTGKVPGQATKQAGLVGQGADALMNTLRGLLLYGNPGFYVANMAGNFGMQMLNDPRSVRYLKDALTKRGDLYHRVTSEMGRGPTAGGINPERNILGRDVSGHPLAGRNLHTSTSNAFEWWNHKLNVAGRKAGSAVDDPFRYATWRQEAYKLGYKSDAQVKGLLDQAIKDTREHGYRATNTKALDDLNKIRDKAEQLMLDFDSLTPFERSYLTRIIFLYPFLKASAKYPFFYAGEHPLTMGALLQTSNVGGQLADQTLGPRPLLPEWAQGYARTPLGMINIGSVDQLSVLGGELQSVLGVGTATPVGINRPFNMLHPGLQLLIEAMQSRNRYGREASLGSILKTDAPLPSYMTQLWRKPSSVYSGQSYIDALKRSLRLYPFGVNKNWQPGGQP